MYCIRYPYTSEFDRKSPWIWKRNWRLPRVRLALEDGAWANPTYSLELESKLKLKFDGFKAQTPVARAVLSMLCVHYLIEH